MVLLSSTFHLLVGPVLSLVYPLFSSIRAIERNSDTSIQEWLTYWVLFTLIRILEFLLGSVLQWIFIWPYAKMIVIFWLVLPYFGGASHVYEYYVRPYFSLDLQKLSVWYIPQHDDFISNRSDDFLMAAERYIEENGADALAKIISQVKSKEPELPKDMVLSSPHGPKITQKDSARELCVVTITCEEDLRRQLKGNKHKENEQLMLDNRVSIFGLAIQGADMEDLVEDMYQNLNYPFARPIQLCKWEKPEVGWTKLNTDGSFCQSKAGLGGLLRDHLGCPTCAYVSKAPQDGIFSVEIWAIWRGLILALGQGVKSIWVESDSMGVVQVINKQCSYHKKYSSCLKQIWVLLNKFEKHRVSHSWRETNRAADHLAKMNLDGKDVVLWPGDFPDSLCNIIKEDAEGKVYLRR